MNDTVYHPAVVKMMQARAGGETRARLSQADPRDPVVARWFSMQNATETGVYIDEDKALCVSTVYACVKVLSESVGMLPILLIKNDADDVEEEKNYYLSRLLKRRPNKWQTPIEFKQMMVAHMVLRGAAYARIITAANGKIDQLIPLHPDRVTPFMAPDGRRAFAYQPHSGGKQILLQDEVFFVPGNTEDGVRPMSVIAYAKETIGLAYATQQYGARYFKNNANPGGVLQHPAKLSDDAYTRLKTDWQERHQGGHNAHKVAILEEGLTWQSLGMTASDSQFIESRQFSPVEICQFFRVPPHKVQLLDRATNNNIENQSIAFVTDTLMPWLVKIEEAANRDLLQFPSEQNNYFFKFDVHELLRGDLAARTAYYASGLQNGYLNRNEVRRAEGKKSVQGLDTYMIQMNMGQGGADKQPKSQKPKLQTDMSEEDVNEN